MGRLKAIPSRLAATKPRLGYPEGDTKAQDKSRTAFSPYRAWYKTAKWRALRLKALTRDLFACRRCGHASASGMVADHIKPHRGDPLLFWDESNLQALCPSCHSSTKQAEERAER